MDDISKHNRAAWDREAHAHNPATLPISADDVERALRGSKALSMTGNRLVPETWLECVPNRDVLALGCGGGQQVPLWAAMGGRVTSVDNAPLQLQRDEEVCTRHSLKMTPILGDLRDLSVLSSGSFDTVWIGLCLQFIPDLTPAICEVARVARRTAQVVVAFVHPAHYIFDLEGVERGEYRAVHRLPYSDLVSLSKEERAALLDPEDPLEFSHTLEGYLGGWSRFGFGMVGFFEDHPVSGGESELMPRYGVACFRR